MISEEIIRYEREYLQASNLIKDYIVPQYTVAHFYVNNPGNLSDPLRLQNLSNMVAELENLNSSWGTSWGAESSYYFIREFLDYERLYQDNGEIVENGI